MKQAILFAGVPGCGKTPLAYHLSWNLGLPIFSNDSIRTEVHEDTLEKQLDINKYEIRQRQRLDLLLNKNNSFILDASIDRSWVDYKGQLKQRGYKYIIISFNLSKEFLIKLYESKPGCWTDQKLIDKYFYDHQVFLGEYTPDIGLVIDKANYHKRLEIALDFVSKE